MDRTLTSGYNEEFSIGERVVDRLVGAEFDSGARPDATSIQTTLPGGPLSADILFSRPSMQIGAMAPDRHITLDIGVAARINAAGFPASLTGNVQVQTQLIVDRAIPGPEWLVPDFANVRNADVTVNSPGAPPGAGPIVAAIIRTLPPRQFGAPISPPRFGLRSDSWEHAVFDDRSGSDKDALDFAFFEKNTVDPSDSDGNPTRGSISTLRSVLADGQSITFVISAGSFDQMIKDFIDRRWLRVELTVPAAPMTVGLLNISAPDSAGNVVISSGASPSHAGVRGRISNQARSQRIRFAADRDGAFSATIQAAIGDRLLVHGDAFREENAGQTVDVRAPRIRLGDGKIHISGTSTIRDVFAGIDVDVDFAADVRLSIDPVTGRFVTRVMADADIGLGWDILIWVLTGPFSGLIQTFFDETVGGQIQSVFGQSLPNLSAQSWPADRVAVFLETISVQTGGLIVGGQLEAGVIHSAGRSRPDLNPFVGRLVQLEKVGRPTFFHIRADNRPGVSSFGSAGIESLGRVSFEQVSRDDLVSPARTYRLTSLTDLLTEEARLVALGALPTVFAIRTGSGRFTKVRIDRDDAMGPIVRWVTYEAPLAPTVRIDGTWNEYHYPQSELPGRPAAAAPAESYSGQFSVFIDTRRLYPSPITPLQIRWEWDGPGSFVPSGTNCTVRVSAGDFDLQRPGAWNLPVAIDMDTPIGSGPPSSTFFGGTLRVTVTDVFGRQATASRHLGGRVGYVGSLPQNIFEFDALPFDPRTPGRPPRP